MTFLRSSAFALAISAVAAFRDTSPFFLLSTSDVATTGLARSQLALSSSLDAQLSKSLSSCPSESYIIVSQPGVSAADYAERISAPYLRKWIAGEDDQKIFAVTVPEVVGPLNGEKISQYLQDRCRAGLMKVDATNGHIPVDDSFPRVVKVEFPELPASHKERQSKLAEHDSFLHAVVSGMRDQSYTIVYITSPPLGKLPHRVPVYQMDDPFANSILHTDLKRDVSAHARNSTLDSHLPLFEKYVFLSPGIFMGLLVSFILFMILYVGITAISGLEVSYFAFSKEMGPAAQRKQQ